MKKIFTTLLTIGVLMMSSLCFAQTGMTASISKQDDQCIMFTTEDGTVTNRVCGRIQVTNGTFTNNGDGSWSLSTGAGAGSGDLKADGTVPLTANWDVGNFDLTLKSLTGDGTIEGAILTEGGVGVYNINQSDAVYEVLLTNEAGLYSVLSDVSDFVQGGEVNSIDSDMYVDDSIDDDHLNLGTGANQISAVDIPIADAGVIITATETEGALQENRTAINLNTAHKTSNGTDHSYINQDVTSASAPTFTADNFSDGGSNAIITTTQETNFGTAYSHVSSNGTDHSYINQDVTSGSSPTFNGVNFTNVAGDDLGDHTATENLDMDDFSLINVSGITAGNGTYTNGLSGKNIIDTGDGATNLASGTTGSRPAGVYGDIRLNSSLGFVELYTGSWETIYTNADNASYQTISTGHGYNELYPMDQSVLTTSQVTHEGLIITNSSSIDSDTGKQYFGDSQDASIYSDGTDMILDDANIDPVTLQAIANYKGGWGFDDPEDTDDFKTIDYRESGEFDVTLTAIFCETDTGTVNFDLQIDDGSPADVNGSDLVCNANGVLDSSLGGDVSFDAGDKIDLAITSVTDTPGDVKIFWFGKKKN